MFPSPRFLLAAALVAALSACDRNLEPFDPDEQPREPDLARIFPEGAERAARESPQGGPPPGAPPERGAPPVAGDSAETVRGRVELAPALEGRAARDAVLFVIARHAGGAGPPLAVKRVGAPRFPYEFEIGPGDRMIQQVPFVGPLALSARLDADGNATTRGAGDLQGSAAAPVQPGATGVVVVLDEVVADGAS